VATLKEPIKANEQKIANDRRVGDVRQVG